MEFFQQMKQWFAALAQKEQMIVASLGLLVISSFIYLIVWQPIHDGLAFEKEKKQTQDKILLWMQTAAIEAKTLRAAGNASLNNNKNTAITLVLDQTIKDAALSSSLGKIESSAKNGARITLNNAPFNQVLDWLNTLVTHQSILVVTTKIDRADSPGRINAHITFERP